MRILLDAMGGDHAPSVTVAGAVQALELRPDLELTLYGRESDIFRELNHLKAGNSRLQIENCSEVIDMHDAPLAAVRRKKDSSLVRGIRGLRDGVGDAFVSAGNTGALMSASLLTLGRLAKVHRPALATYLPTEKGGCILCDVGANPSPKSLDLLQNGFMAVEYARILLQKESPTVGLLNIGEEAFKGSHFDRSTFELLQSTMPRFIGNVEGNQVLKGQADVVITDGFVGNILIKFGESVFEFFFKQMKEEVKRSLLSQLGSLFLRGSFRNIKRNLNYEEYGGAPLLGVKGLAVKAHGHSSALAIRNALLQACRFAEHDLTHRINEKLESLSDMLRDLGESGAGGDRTEGRTE